MLQRFLLIFAVCFVTVPVIFAQDFPVDLYHERAGQLSGGGRYMVFSGTLPDDSSSTPAGQLYLYDSTDDSYQLITGDAAGNPIGVNTFPYALSMDGSTVAFWSYSPPMADPNTFFFPSCDTGHIYIYEVRTKTREQIEIGNHCGLGMTDDISLSGNGQIMGFATNGQGIKTGVWLYDRGTDEFTQVLASGWGIDLSWDGMWFAVATDESLVDDDTNGEADVYLMNTIDNNVVWVSHPRIETASGQPSGVAPFHEGVSVSFDLSDDGRYVVFSSRQAGLTDDALFPCTFYTGEVLPVCQHVYLYDHKLDTLELISTDSNGVAANDMSDGGIVTDGGRYVMFNSRASNLQARVLPNPVPWLVYVKDRATGGIHLVSQTVNGDIPDGFFNLTVASPLKRMVFFESDATNIVTDYFGATAENRALYRVDVEAVINR